MKNSQIKSVVFTFSFFLSLFQYAKAYTEPTLQEVASRYEARTFNDGLGHTLSYRFFKPKNYNPLQSYPLVLFLHGSGERGSDNTSQLKNTGPGAFSDSALVQTNHPCFVIAPQCPTGVSWKGNWPGTASVKLVKTIQTEFNIDLDRTYITGLSMGAMGAWWILSQDSSPFAAAVPISGGPNTTDDAPKLINFPIWASHGINDGIVAYSTTFNMIKAINDAGGNAMLTPLNTAHDAWIYTYVDLSLIEWLFSQAKYKPFIPDTKVTSSVNELNLNVNESAQITPTILPSNASNGYYINWTSSNSAIAAISYMGLIKAYSAGTAVIKLTTQKGNVDSCIVYVTFVSTTGIELTPKTATVEAGKQLQITAVVTPENASNPTVFWESLNKSVATVQSSTGLVTAIAPGEAKIRATTKNGQKKDSCMITVTGLLAIDEMSKNLPEIQVMMKPGRSNEINFLLKGVENNENISVSIIDLQSRNLFRKEMNGTYLIHSISTEALKPGIYILKVQSRKFTLTKKIIIE